MANRTITALNTVFFPDRILDDWVEEDVPYIDLSTWALGIAAEPGRIEFRARSAMVVCAADLAARLAARLGATPEMWLPDGERVEAGALLCSATGEAAALHAAWKQCANILEYAGGVATRTRDLVDRIQAVAPRCSLAATRKHLPGARRLLAKAVLAGGGLPHRLGLSETVLVFDRHRAFSDAAPAEMLAGLRRSAPEKTILVEAASLAEALPWLDAGVDGVQFDKLPPGELAAACREARRRLPRALIVATGGITPANAADYAACGADVVSTSSVYHGQPADVAATIAPAAARHSESI